MGLWDVVSGKVARENKFDRLISGPSLDRLQAIKVEGTLKNYGIALVFAVEETAKSLTLTAKNPDWQRVAKDGGAVWRLACYLGSLLSARAIERNPRWFQDTGGLEDATSAQMRADFAYVASEIFPTHEPQVAAAVDRTLSADETALRSNSSSAVHALELFASFQELMGIAPATAFDDETMRDNLRYGAAVINGIGSVSAYLGSLSNEA